MCVFVGVFVGVGVICVCDMCACGRSAVLTLERVKLAILIACHDAARLLATVLQLLKSHRNESGHGKSTALARA